MKHHRAETPAYLFWVHARPSLNGKGKATYVAAVQEVARAAIDRPIDSNDIEVELVYTTGVPSLERMDSNNVLKPTLDALEGIAYQNDRQVRDSRCMLVDKLTPSVISGRVENMGPLFGAPEMDSVLIMIYSDTRLEEMGGEVAVKQKRFDDWDREFTERLNRLRTGRG